MFLGCWLAALSQAQAPALTDGLPGASVAGEGGATGLWLNPALPAWNREGRSSFGFSTSPTVTEASATLGRGGMGILVASQFFGGDSATRAQWTGAFRIGDGMSLGTNLGPTFASGGEVDLAVDLGVILRPVPAVALGAAFHDHGGLTFPTPTVRYGFAVASHGGRTHWGIDHAIRPDVESMHTFFLAAGARPHPAVGIRGTVGVTPGPEIAWMGGGALTLAMGGAQVGGGAVANTESMGAIWVGTDEWTRPIAPVLSDTVEFVISGSYPDQPSRGLFASNGPTWPDLMTALGAHATSRSKRDIWIHLDGADLSWARASEIRRQIQAMREGGKRVFVYATGNVDTRSWWIATAAEHVSVDPAGQLEIIGGSLALHHARELLDKVGLSVQVARRSEYKSAPETLTRNEPTAENLEQIEALLDELFGHVTTTAAASMESTPEAIGALIDAAPFSAEEALKAGLVDAILAYEDRYEPLGHGADSGARRASAEVRPLRTTWPATRTIEVIHVTGAIVDGWGGGGPLSGRSTGSDAVVAQIRDAANDDNVAAIVVRVDSPGGSAQASDEIWHAIRSAKQEKPVVASLGSVAASGGYYVACAADAILAEPTTITGSIGAFAQKISAEQLKSHLGVHTTLVNRGRNADIWSSSRTWDDAQQERVQALIDGVYDMFKARVAEGRGMELEAVEERARGRVWSGEAALKLGLIDASGGLLDAIALASVRADLPKGHRQHVEYGSDSRGVLSAVLGQVATAAGAAEWEGMSSLLEPVALPLLLASQPDGTVWALDDRFFATP